MPNPIAFDTSGLSPEDALKLQTFLQRYEAPHLWLVAHAAFPVVLTPDLLYKLWQNFRKDEHGEWMRIPAVAVSDVLMSSLCRSTGRSLFEIPADIRTALLRFLRREERFGPARLRRLAFFLKFYLRENPRAVPSPAFFKAQEFTFLAQLDPETAARQLLGSWERGDTQQLKRRLAWSEPHTTPYHEAPEAPGGAHPLQVAIEFLKGVQSFREGDEQTSQRIMQRLKEQGLLRTAEEGTAGIKTRIPASVKAALDLAEKETEVRHFAKIHLLIHPSLDRESLAQELFHQKVDPSKTLNLFQWKPDLNDVGLIGEITYNIWMWSTNLPSELDRFLLTPAGMYFLAVPGHMKQEELLRLKQIVYRLDSQVGQEKLYLLIDGKVETVLERFEKSSKQILGYRNITRLSDKQDFSHVLLELLEKNSFPNPVPHVEVTEKEELAWKISKNPFENINLPQSVADNRAGRSEQLLKLNQAGIVRHLKDEPPVAKGFLTFLPSEDCTQVFRWIKVAKKGSGWLSSSEAEDMKIHPRVPRILESLGMGLEHRDGEWYFPAQLEERESSFDFSTRETFYLRCYYNFLPYDLRVRLLARLQNAGIILGNPHEPVLPNFFNETLDIHADSVSSLLEIKITESFGEFKEHPVLTTIEDYLESLIYKEKELLHAFDQIQAIFTLLNAAEKFTSENHFKNLHKDWQQLRNRLIHDQGADSIRLYLKDLEQLLKELYSWLKPHVSNKEIAIPAKEKIAEIIQNILEGEESQNYGVHASYPYPLSFRKKTLRIPAHASPEMVQVEGGTFTMGWLNKERDGDGNNDEKPAHEVRLDTFSISKYQLTFNEFDAFCEVTGRKKPEDRGWGRDRRPAINVDWYDAVEYCNWLSEIWGLEKAYEIDKKREDSNNKSDYDNKKWLVSRKKDAGGYRLPTEAEWEYAARGGQESENYRYAGRKSLPEVGWYRNNGGSKTYPVGERKPNELGLYDMSGNVFELCWDWFSSDYYKSSPKDNPQGPESGTYRVLRGGAWDYRAQYCRVSHRYHWLPTLGPFVGFRLVRSS